MRVELRQRLTIEVNPINGRLVCRVFAGDQEHAVSPELLGALTSLINGGRHPDAIRFLARSGILEEGVDHSPDLGSRVRLGPNVAVGFRLRPAAGEVEGPEGRHVDHVLPENSLPIGLFVPPGILSSLQRLDASLKRTWMTILRGATSRGESVDQPRAVAMLSDVVDAHLQADPVLSRVVKWSDARTRRALVPAMPLQVETLFYPVDTVELTADRSPAVRSPHETIALRSGADAIESVEAMGRLLGVLARGLPSSELAEILASPLHRSSRQLWEELLRRGWIDVDYDAEPIALEPGQIMHLGHATLLARLGDAFVLIDPWILPGSREDATPPIRWSDLPPLDAVLFTHHHWDHVNLETLLKLDKRVPVYVPSQSRAAPLVPMTAQLLRSLGFESVRTLHHDETVEFPGGGRVIAAPFYGEDPTGIGYGANTYILVHQGRAALVHVDSGTNLAGESMVSTGVASRLTEAHGPLSPVLATRRQERGTMVEHTWEYLLQPVAKWVEPTENCCNDAAFLGALAASCRASEMVLYSEGGADYYPIGTDFLRGPTPRPTDAALEYGWDTLEQITERVEAAGARIRCAAPGQVFVIGGGA